MRTYLVTQGEYSDHRVLCAAPDRATADAIVERINRVESNSESWGSARVVEVETYASADAIGCYTDWFGDATWPWSYDYDPERAKKVAAERAAKAAAEEAGL